MHIYVLYTCLLLSDDCMFDSICNNDEYLPTAMIDTAYPVKL